MLITIKKFGLYCKYLSFCGFSEKDILFLGRAGQSTCEEMCHTFKWHFTAFQPLALVYSFLSYRWNLHTKPKSQYSSQKNLTNCMTVTEMKNYQTFQVKNLLFWLIFQCTDQSVNVLIRRYLKQYLMDNFSSFKEMRISSPSKGRILLKSYRGEIYGHFLPFSLSACHKMFQ